MCKLLMYLPTCLEKTTVRNEQQMQLKTSLVLYALLLIPLGDIRSSQTKKLSVKNMQFACTVDVEYMKKDF